MADFIKAFKETMSAEGGYVNDPQDPGGETYMGVSRVYNPNWPGWSIIDNYKGDAHFPKVLKQDSHLLETVMDLYALRYWNKIWGAKILRQEVANSLFDFAVNAGTRTCIKLAQKTVGANPDGVFGPHTLRLVNEDDARGFLSTFAVNKIKKYIRICERRGKSRKYFFGWVRRALDKM